MLKYKFFTNCGWYTLRTRGRDTVTNFQYETNSPYSVVDLIFLIGLILWPSFFEAKFPYWRSLLLQLRSIVWLALCPKIIFGSKLAGRVGTFFHDFSPFLFIILIYESLGDLIQYLHPDIDPWLIQIDFSIFGVHPTLWMEQWIVPWFTDIMSFAYISYYFLPVIFILTLYLKNRIWEFDESDLCPALWLLSFHLLATSSFLPSDLAMHWPTSTPFL